MKSFLFLLLIVTYSAHAQRQKPIFFDESRNVISEDDYLERSYQLGFLKITGDSSHHRVLVSREETGTIRNKKLFDSLLTVSTGRLIDSSKPILIHYYPGKDPCNSSGRATRKSYKKGYNWIEKQVNKIRATNVIYVYKSDKGLYRKCDGFKEWIEDPNQIPIIFFRLPLSM